MLRLKRVFQIFFLGSVLLLTTLWWIGSYTDQGLASASRHLLGDGESDELSNYPPSLFTKEQRQNGAVILHVLGVLYMFAALAIICDEFFVPSLDVICDKMDLQDDVAGATFMAAGGSAPELATSFIGTFVSQSNVGFGTIVGSAVFNILFVIGTCAMVAPSEIELTWWPMARDSTFYAVSLGVLIAFFHDKVIHWWEALILFCCYILYVSFMKYNVVAEKAVRGVLGLEVEETEEKKEDIEMNAVPQDDKEKIKAGSTAPSGSPRADKERVRMHFGMHTLFSSQRKIDAMEHKQFRNESQGKVPPQVDSRAKRNWTITRIKVMSRVRKRRSMSDIVLMAMADPELVDQHKTLMSSDQRFNPSNKREDDEEDEDDDDDGPMDLEWPSTVPKQISYVILAPLTFLLYYTVPDVRREGNEKYFAVTFLLSILYIGFFSYFMVWWVTLVGDTMEIPSEVMGLTVLAIGTSVPDLLESVIVAKQGKGDMAVSSSIGSNIFDITIGLPIPWLLFCLIYQTSIEVGTGGLFVSVILLFAMLVSCIATIALMGWKMTKTLGVVFFILWVVFVGISLIVEFVF